MPDTWDDARRAAALFAVDPTGAGGAILSGPGPARDAWLARVIQLLPADTPVRRCPLNIADDRLLGDLDLAATLAAGRAVAQRGLLADADGGVVVTPMAERMSDAAAARLAGAMDEGLVRVARNGLTLTSPARIAVIALDDSASSDERPPAALVDRCAFRLDLSGIRDIADDGVGREDILAARARLVRVAPADDDLVEMLCAATIALGVASARAPILALRLARVAAALDGRDRVTPEDVAEAARFVLTPRATCAPDLGEDPEPAEPPPENESSSERDATAEGSRETLPEDLVIAAVRAALPEGLLAELAQHDRTRTQRAHASGDGARVAAARRGRPIASRTGALRPGDRLDVVQTLRAAAPWQRLRGAAPGRVAVRREDFRIRRFVTRREATTVFVVDASGSAAFQRLAEAKGAVEQLLGTAYVTRARVALVSFRGAGAEVLLPPTRSLSRARRLLSDLPGGGGTPLAQGVEAAFLLAQAEKAKGRTPTLLLLSDGRANIGRDGAPGRAQAESDALAVARLVRANGIRAIHVDTSPHPRPGGDALAREMGARYAPLPYLHSGAVISVLQG